MSHKATDWAFDQKLPALQKLVLIVLADRHNKDTGRCDPSISRVAEDCGMSKDAVRSALKGLQEKGLVIAHERFDGPVQLTNFYTFNLKAETTPPPAEGEGGSGSQPVGGSGSQPPKPVSNKPVREPLKALPSKKAVAVATTILPAWLDAETWAEFREMRKRIGHPMTAYAEKLMLGKLEKFEARGISSRDLLERSIVNGWRDVFVPEQSNGNYRPMAPASVKLIETEFKL